MFTPFLGIGSEVYAAIEMDRFGVGIELKPSYFGQAKRNIAQASARRENDLFAAAE